MHVTENDSDTEVLYWEMKKPEHARVKQREVRLQFVAELRFIASNVPADIPADTPADTLGFSSPILSHHSDPPKLYKKDVKGTGALEQKSNPTFRVVISKNNQQSPPENRGNTSGSLMENSSEESLGNTVLTLPGTILLCWSLLSADPPQRPYIRAGLDPGSHLPALLLVQSDLCCCCVSLFSLPRA